MTDYLLGLVENKNRSDAVLADLHLSDEAIEMLKSGRINNRLFCELITHPEFPRLMADMEIYVDGMVSMQIRNLNALLESVRTSIVEKYDPKEDNTLRALKAAQIDEDEYFARVVSNDVERILTDLKQQHSKDMSSASVESPLEHLTKPKSDQSGSKGEKSQMDISSAFISDEQAPVSMEPGKGSLNNPAVLSKMRGTVHPTSGNAVLYMSHGARLSAKRKIVPFISVKFLRMTSGSPVQISQGRQMIQHIFQHFAIIHIGGSEADNKRNAIAIRYEMMFASRTTSIYGVGSCVFAPLFAWMTEPSIQALLQSIFFVSCKFCRMTW